MANTKTIRLEDRVEEIENDLEEVENEQEEIVQEAIEAEENGEEISSEKEVRFDDLEVDRVELNGELESINRTLEDWEDGEFEIRELSYGQVQRISDDVLEKSFDVDVATESLSGSPKQGYYEIQILKEAIVDAPDNAPDNPADYPQLIGEFLFDKVNAFNTVGDTEMGNMSLQDKMKQRRG